jgi:hypothetical protein
MCLSFASQSTRFSLFRTLSQPTTLVQIWDMWDTLWRHQGRPWQQVHPPDRRFSVWLPHIDVVVCTEHLQEGPLAAGKSFGSPTSWVQLASVDVCTKLMPAVGAACLLWLVRDVIC